MVIWYPQDLDFVRTRLEKLRNLIEVDGAHMEIESVFGSSHYVRVFSFKSQGKRVNEPLLIRVSDHPPKDTFDPAFSIDPLSDNVKGVWKLLNRRRAKKRQLGLVRSVQSKLDSLADV